MLMIVLTDVHRPKVRCRECAGEPVPDPIPERVLLVSGRNTMTHLGLLALDFSRPRDRVPGEDDQ